MELSYQSPNKLCPLLPKESLQSSPTNTFQFYEAHGMCWGLSAMQRLQRMARRARKLGCSTSWFTVWEDRLSTSSNNHPLHKPSREVLSLTLYVELQSFPKELRTEHPPHQTQRSPDKATDGSGTLRLRDFLSGQYWHGHSSTQQKITLVYFYSLQ